MADQSIQVVVTTKVEEQFEDYLSFKAKQARESEEPEQPKMPGQSKEAEEPRKADNSEELGQPLIHQATGLQIPYPPGSETTSLQGFTAQFEEVITHLMTLTDRATISSTAEIAANSPRYRRRSSTFIDGVHDLPDENASPMAPAQLYSTMSGRLFHSGRIAIVLVGPPARGKT
jgi:hypothetical protein